MNDKRITLSHFFQFLSGETSRNIQRSLKPRIGDFEEEFRFINSDIPKKPKAISSSNQRRPACTKVALLLPLSLPKWTGHDGQPSHLDKGRYTVCSLISSGYDDHNGKNNLNEKGNAVRKISTMHVGQHVRGQNNATLSGPSLRGTPPGTGSDLAQAGQRSARTLGLSGSSILDRVLGNEQCKRRRTKCPGQ